MESLNPGQQAFPSSTIASRSQSGTNDQSPTLPRLNLKSESQPHASPEILAPTPRRHLLESSESQHWLRTPPLSPSSSRGVSPVSLFSSASLERRVRTTSYYSTRPSSSSLRTLFDSDKSKELAGNGNGRKHEASDKQDIEMSMGRMWVRWMHKRNMKGWVIPALVAVSTLLKWCIGLGSYSGEATPPMFGDYEAQRHWMELTVHLHTSQWYTYDLEYWGLDYPPLTAYVSWICGKIGYWINPAWVALNASRGIETPESKVFMRATVLALDLLIYVPALLMFVKTWQGSRSNRTQNLSLLTLLFQPALLLIDFGHFQYNSVMLGLTILALNFFAQGQDVLGAICFVLSLGFKQMSLYYAPAIGSYLISKCIYLGPKAGWRLFVRLAIVTTASSVLLFLPFLPPFAPFEAILQPIQRIFPFARGLFEDKVANFWCASNVVFKWKRWASTAVLVKLSTVFTLLAFLPGVFILIRTAGKTSVGISGPAGNTSSSVSSTHSPTLPLLPYALLTSAMSFFLFSFQVHEKTILLPLLPITLLLCGAPAGSTMFGWGVLVNNVAVFSMWPLLKRDGLGLQYIITMLFWNRLIGYDPRRLPSRSFVQLLSFAVYGAAGLLHLAEFILPAPARYPDIFPVLNVLISTPVFILAWLWSIKNGIEVGWALGGLGQARKTTSTAPATAAASLAEATVKRGVTRAASLGFSNGRRRAPTASSASSSGRPRTATNMGT
ncbi:Glucosyltransferase-like protein [Pleurotus pulmonarius]|nr:Glucosyltransferase-like protein [Pleurotus pulmonarius]KAF4590838.1 Glucosyltransferase-like protein [Pleurotus pulmonarius]